MDDPTRFATPSGQDDIEYQPVQQHPTKWKPVEVPDDLKYKLKGVNNHRYQLVILNNWIEWLVTGVSRQVPRRAEAG